MSKKEKMTPEDFLNKIEWEGGIDAALDYGLLADRLDDSDPELKNAWAQLEAAFNNALRWRQVVEKKLAAYFSSGDEDEDEEETF